MKCSMNRIAKTDLGKATTLFLGEAMILPPNAFLVAPFISGVGMKLQNSTQQMLATNLIYKFTSKHFHEIWRLSVFIAHMLGTNLIYKTTSFYSFCVLAIKGFRWWIL